MAKARRGPKSGLNQGIERVSAILRSLSRLHKSGARLTDVADETGLSKATVHRLLSGLAKAGLIEQDTDKSLFYLSFEMFVFGAAAANRYGLVDIARNHMTRLESRTSDTVFLSVRSGFDAICVHRVEGSYPIKVLTLAVGDRRPLGVGAGSLALLAFHPDDEIERIIEGNRDRLASLPKFSVSRLYEMVETTRKAGYSFNQGDIISDMYALGVPVMGPAGRPITAISVAAVTSRLDNERRLKVVQWLKDEATAIEERIAALTANLTQAGIASLTAA